MTRTEAVAIFLPASLIAVSLHLSGGWLSDRWPLRTFLVVLLLGMALSTVGFAWLGRGLPYAALIVGNGIAGGMFGLLSAITWPRLFGRRHLGAISGMNLSLSVFCSALGPFLFSQVLAWTGRYRLAGVLCGLLALGLLAAACAVSPPARRVAARRTRLAQDTSEKESIL